MQVNQIRTWSIIYCLFSIYIIYQCKNIYLSFWMISVLPTIGLLFYQLFVKCYQCLKQKMIRSRICKNTIHYTEIKEIEAGWNDECVICLEKFHDKDRVIFLNCGCTYLFHQACIQEWFKKEMSCPFCRKRFD